MGKLNNKNIKRESGENIFILTGEESYETIVWNN